MSSAASSKMRDTFCLWCAKIDAVPVENGDTSVGHPDVDSVAGPAELKRVARYPRGDETPIEFKSFTDDQRIWLLRRRRAGGPAFVVLLVAGDWYLLDGEVAAKRLGLAGRRELQAIAIRWWAGGRGAAREMAQYMMSEAIRCFGRLATPAA